MKNVDGVHGEKVMRKDHLFFAIVLLVVTAVVFLFVSQKVLKIVEEGCYNRLREYAEVASNEFIMNNLHYGGTLQFVADALSDRADYSIDSLQPKLNEMQPFLRDQKISILLPGDVVILPDGVVTDASKMQISFEAESKGDVHVSVRLESDKPEEKLLYHFVPIKSHGQVVAVAFWNFSLGLIHQYLRKDKRYDRKMFVYVINRDDGRFIADTKHDSLKSIHDYMNEMDNERGLFSALVDSMLVGATGEACVENYWEESNCFFYKPLAVNHWSIVISSPEKVALWHCSARVFCGLFCVAPPCGHPKHCERD